MDDELLGRQSAIAEARALYKMLGEKNTVEELRELITVPPWTEHVLRAYTRANPEDSR